MWGSFDYGMAHFVSISTETDFYQYVLLILSSDS